jgi:butyryl-CoA dehydrogenase
MQAHAEDKNERNRKSIGKGVILFGEEGKLRVRLRPAGKDRQAEYQGEKDEGAEETGKVRPYVPPTIIPGGSSPAGLPPGKIERQGGLMERLLIEEIRDTAMRIAVERLRPRAVETDRERTFPRENMKVLGEAGFHRLIVSEEGGGLGLGRNIFASVVTEIAESCASTALVYVSSAVVGKAIELAAGDVLKKKWLPKMMESPSLGAFAVHEPDSGSNAGAITARAKKEDGHYVINGTKFFITSAGEADVYLVLARTNPEKGPQGMTTLLVEKDAPGLSFGRPEDKMGLTSTSSRELFFSDCRVPADYLVGKEGEGTQVIGKTVIGWGFFGAAAISLGIAKSATELAIEHAKERMIAGQPIGAHQAVQFMITDMVLKTDAAESLVYACASNADSAPGTAVINGFKAKLFASEAAVEITNLAIQVLGGHGYTRDYVVERLFRDARGLTLHFKTSEWLRQDVAKATLGL